MSLNADALEVEFEGCPFGVSARRIHEHITLGQINPFGRRVSSVRSLRDAAALIDVVRFDALGYAGTTPRAAGTNILQVVQSGPDTLVQIDVDGAPGAQGFGTLMTLVGVSAATITDSFFLFQ